MTGTRETDEQGREIIRVQNPPVLRWLSGIAASLLVIVLVGMTALLLDYRSFQKEWAEKKLQVQENTEFRLRGDRVTPDDLKAIKDSFEQSFNTQNRLIEKFVESSNKTNGFLIEMGQTLTRIDTRLESVEKEQDRARDERKTMRTGG